MTNHVVVVVELSFNSFMLYLLKVQCSLCILSDLVLRSFIMQDFYFVVSKCCHASFLL